MDPGPSEELEPVLEARQRARRAAEEDALRVIPEGDDGRHRAERPGLADVRGEDRLVSEMDAVEDADADDGSFAGGALKSVAFVLDDHPRRAAVLGAGLASL
jgi:hypothetical protein